MYIKVVKNLDFYTITYNFIDYGDPKVPKDHSKAVFKPLGVDLSSNSINDSIRRTKRVIKDYGRNNKWDYFFTATFDPKVYDSSDIFQVKHLVRMFCQILRRNDYKYLLVPEYHKDKHKIHIHGLLIGSGLELVDSGKNSSSGRSIYNVPQWKYGFTTLVPVDNIKAVSNYICKYITKDLLTDFGKKRYWCSKGLNRGVVVYSRYEDSYSDDQLSDITNYGWFGDYTYRSDNMIVREVSFDSLPDCLLDSGLDYLNISILLGRTFESEVSYD